jgi:hypothetical protein
MSEEFTRAYRKHEAEQARGKPSNEERAAYFRRAETTVAEQVQRKQCFNGALEVLGDVVRGAVILIVRKLRGKRK